MSKENNILTDKDEMDAFLGPLSDNFEQVQNRSEESEDPEETIPTIRPPEPEPKQEQDPEEDRVTVQPPEPHAYPPPEYQNPTVDYNPTDEKLSVTLNRNHEDFGKQLRAIMKATEDIRQKLGLWSKQERDGENLLITFEFPPSKKTD